MSSHNYDLLPKHMVMAIELYVEKGHGLGHFLHALFANDLFEAVGRADEDTLRLLSTYCSYVWNKCPSGCHGSYEIVKEWRKKKERENV